MKDLIGVTIILCVLLVLDMVIIGGIFLHGKANFADVYKHLSA